MSDVLVLQNCAPEGPAAIGDALVRAGHVPRVVHAYGGAPVPARLDAAEALVVMGGPMGVYEADRYPQLRDEMRLIEDAVRRGRPVLGVCLGSQLLAAALGGRVYPSGRREIGWYPITLNAAAATDTLLQAAPREFIALCWHGDVFDLPVGAVGLASSAMTEHQAFRYGEHAYGLLFHLEATPAQVERMVADFPDELISADVSPEALLRGAGEHLPAVSALGAQVFDRFAHSIP
jgi:GMP synthase (glutamine-hydrolysing)